MFSNWVSDGLNENMALVGISESITSLRTNSLLPISSEYSAKFPPARHNNDRTVVPLHDKVPTPRSKLQVDYRHLRFGARSVGTDLESQSDENLIAAYLQGDRAASDILVNRHYSSTYNRIHSGLQRYPGGRNRPDLSADLTQNTWKNVIRSLDSYKDEEKFPNWVNRIAGNVIIDWYRKDQERTVPIVDPLAKGDIDDNQMNDPYYGVASAADPEQDAILQEQVSLMMSYIPTLPANQRMVFLLRFESNLWEPGQPLTWDHLAQLNAISVDEAWDRFNRARDDLLTGKKLSEIDTEDLLIFMVWTQANRPNKPTKITMSYFADILGESENTLTTQYRTAVKKLNKLFLAEANNSDQVESEAEKTDE